MNKQKLIESAIDILRTYEAAGEALRPVNDAIRVLYGDFYPHMRPAAEGIEDMTIKLCDEILGEDLASYYLYECRGMKNGGSITEKSGKKWPIKTLVDVRNYALHLAKLEKKNG